MIFPLVFINTGNSANRSIQTGRNVNFHPFIQEAQNSTLHLCFCKLIIKETCQVSLGRIPEAGQERGGAMNGNTEEKLHVSHTAIGFPWSFTQPRSDSVLVPIVIPDQFLKSCVCRGTKFGTLVLSQEKEN